MASQHESSNNTNSSHNEGSNDDERPIKRGRGLAKKAPKWGVNKLNIQVNNNWQPCGGDYTELASQIGFIIKDGYSFPLTENWKDMDPLAIERAWKEIEVTCQSTVFYSLHLSVERNPDARERTFIDIFGKDQHGRMRCMGRSFTPTMIYGRRCGDTSAENVANVRAEFEEKMELHKQEMEMRMQAEREANKTEMEARIQAEREAMKNEMEAFKKEIFSQLFQSQHQS